MKFDLEQLERIYDRTSGYCHICHKKLAFKNYGVYGARGAWEVEHSNPRANGGTNRHNNLYAACVTCNRSKGTKTTRSARAQSGKTRAPLSKGRRKDVKARNALAAGIVGAAVGSVLLGPVGILIGSGVGASLGYDINPDE